MSSARRSGLVASCISRPFALAIAANIKCFHRDAGRMPTDMLTHFPAIFSNARMVTVLFSSASEIRACSFRSLSSGIRNKVVLKSHMIPRYLPLYSRRFQIALGVRQEVSTEKRDEHAYVESLCGGQPLFLVGAPERGDEVCVPRIVDVREDGDAPRP